MIHDHTSTSTTGHNNSPQQHREGADGGANIMGDGPDDEALRLGRLAHDFVRLIGNLEWMWGHLVLWMLSSRVPLPQLEVTRATVGETAATAEGTHYVCPRLAAVEAYFVLVKREPNVRVENDQDISDIGLLEDGEVCQIRSEPHPSTVSVEEKRGVSTPCAPQVTALTRRDTHDKARHSRECCRYRIWISPR